MVVTLQFSTERAIDSALIRFLTWSDISHVDIVVQRWLLGAKLWGGVMYREASKQNFSRVIQAQVDVPTETAYEVYARANAQEGKPYDWRGILNFAHQRNWRDENSWFCSELVAWAFEEAGFPLLNIGADVWRVTPRDLLISPYVKVVS